MSGRPSRLVLALLAAFTAVLATAVAVLAPSASAATAAPSGLHVSGNKLLDSSGKTIVLRGVNRSGAEYQCVHGYGIFDGPTNDDASIAAMVSWHINAVRVPLNEDCWLGFNAPDAYSGANYRSAIVDYVNRLHAAGLVAILDLHWSAPGRAVADHQQNMPDTDNSPTFWTSVANTFKSDSSTVFDLFNEPHDVSWTCWRDGGDCGIGYQVAGMQSLVNIVRATGATNPVLVGGLAYANDLSQWLQYRPTDPTGNLMASWHTYGQSGTCNNSSCWDSQVAPVIASVPVVTGEVGEYDCAHGYLDVVLPWLDSHATGYLAWSWGTFSCDSPALITSYDGTPTAYGIGLRDHLAALAGGTDPPPSGSLTAATSVDRHAAPYYFEEDLDLTPSATVTKLTVTVTVARTSSTLANNDYYNTAASGVLRTKQTTGTSTLVYRTVLVKNKTLGPNGMVRIADQFNNPDGSAHATSGDTYTIVATVGGKKVKQSGHF